MNRKHPINSGPDQAPSKPPKPLREWQGTGEKGREGEELHILFIDDDDLMRRSLFLRSANSLEAGEASWAPDPDALVNTKLGDAGVIRIFAISIEEALFVRLLIPADAILTVPASHSDARVSALVGDAVLPVEGAVTFGFAFADTFVPNAFLLLPADQRGKVTWSLHVENH